MKTGRIHKLVWLTILIGARQTWKLLCNLYLLSYQPYLTLKTVWEERDKSQIFLLATTTILPSIIYIMARIVWDLAKYGVVLQSVGRVFSTVVIIEGVIFAYLGYWIWQVAKTSNINLKGEEK